jgi:hydroxyacylglutathione hydrolase
MGTSIKRIAIGGFGNFSCYLIRASSGFILVDTGVPPSREALVKGLNESGCLPGGLKLALLTSRGMDSTGNGAFIRARFDAPMAMHALDAESMGKRTLGDREWKSRLYAAASKLAAPLGKKMIAQTVAFEPDILVDEGFDLSAYGLDARILHLPGYTKGSIGVLTPDGDFFAGNTIVNAMNALISPYVLGSYAELDASLRRAMKLGIKTIYPLQGPPLAMRRFEEAYESRKLRWLRERGA